MRFEWEPSKAKANLLEHGVSFAEAVTALDDDHALTREDPDADDEPRFESRMSFEVISAWKANKRQRVRYEKGRS